MLNITQSLIHGAHACGVGKGSEGNGCYMLLDAKFWRSEANKKKTARLGGTQIATLRSIDVELINGVPQPSGSSIRTRAFLMVNTVSVNLMAHSWCKLR